jgi:NAD+ kinase
VRTVLLVVHTGRAENQRTAERVARVLGEAGLRTRVLADEVPDLKLDESVDAAVQVVTADADAVRGVEVVMVLGGDGTLLRAAELVHEAAVPVLGVNLGRVGFLAEVDQKDLDAAVAAVAARAYQVDQRMTIDVRATHNGTELVRTWALNEASVEKTTREKILEVVLEVDGRPVSEFGCDGVLCATPTGSTAYAFSAGGPVVWPSVEALLLVPSNAHALFARPLVVSPDSVVALEVVADGHPAVLCCDGRRTFELPSGARVEVRRGARPIRLVRLATEPFTDRLVRKFSLPVQGWRGVTR